MAHTTNIITRPVVMPDDVAAVLGIPGTDLQAVCQSQNVNTWAKIKPIKRSQKEILTFVQRQQANFGMSNIPMWTNINKMANFWTGYDTTSTNWPIGGPKQAYWKWEKPSSYFRLSDFYDIDAQLGYYHKAEAPIGMSEYAEYTISGSGLLRILYKNGAQANGTIALSDLNYPQNPSKSIGNFYFGVIMAKLDSNGNVITGQIYAKTQMKVSDIQTLGAWCDISGLDSSYNGVWKIFPFLSADEIAFTNHMGQLTEGQFIAVQEAEIVGIGTTIIRMNILQDSMAAYRDIKTSTRILYCSIGLINSQSNMTIGATVLFEVFDSSNNLIGQTTVTPSASGGSGQMPANSTKVVKGTVDMGSLSALGNAYSVRATVTPDYGTNREQTFDSCLVTDGPQP